VLNYDRHHNKYLIGKTWLPAKYFIKIEVEDAPVFDKPVLRKIASLKENECIEIPKSPNDIIRDLVLEQAEREGLSWGGGDDIKPRTPFYLYCRLSRKKRLTHSHNPNYTILPASKFVEVPPYVQEPKLNGLNATEIIIDEAFKPETDWSKVPFPEGYLVPKGIICVNLVDAVWNDFIIPSGSKLKSLQDSSAPYLENLEGSHRAEFHDSYGYVDACLAAHNLAPINATDHPNHPEFGKKQEEPITEPQKDDCKAADQRINELENETITKGEQANVATPFSNWYDKVFKEPYMDERQEMHQKTLSENNKLYSQLETIKRLAKIAIQHEDYEHMRVILKSIANGEI
jgi:hypothetical protein